MTVLVSSVMVVVKTTKKLESCISEAPSKNHNMDKTSKDKGQEFGDSASKKNDQSLIKPFTACNVLYYYSPALGTASYTILSISVLNPTLRLSFFPKRDMTNVLLAATLFGTGCYIYSRPHLKTADKNSRCGYSVLGSIMFSFSSVLLWAVLRSMLPENVAVCSAAGIASSYVLVQGATNYLGFVDTKVAKQ